MDNSRKRTTDIFFYGLYMDDRILHERGVFPRNKRKGIVSGRRLRIGKNSTLLRDINSVAHGIVCSLNYNEIHKLYAGCGLDQYIPETLMVKSDEQCVTALCYVLLDPPSDDETNEAYFQKLKICMHQYGMPIPKKV